MENPYRMAACVSRLKMPRYFMSWCGRMAWRIQRWCLPALVRARSLGVRQAGVGILLGHHPTPLLTIDPRDTIDRHGVGEDQVVEFVTLPIRRPPAEGLLAGVGNLALSRSCRRSERPSAFRRMRLPQTRRRTRRTRCGHRRQEVFSRSADQGVGESTYAFYAPTQASMTACGAFSPSSGRQKSLPRRPLSGVSRPFAAA